MVRETQQAAQGLKLLLAAQLLGLTALLPYAPAQAAGLAAALALELWGLGLAGKAHRGFRLAFVLAWVKLVLLALVAGLPLAAARLHGASAVLLFLAALGDPLAELLRWSLRALVCLASADLLRKLGETGAGDRAALWGKTFLAAGALCVLLAAAAALTAGASAPAGLMGGLLLPLTVCRTALGLAFLRLLWVCLGALPRRENKNS